MNRLFKKSVCISLALSISFWQSIGFSQDTSTSPLSLQACIEKKQELVGKLEEYKASLNATLKELDHMESQGKYTVNRNAKVSTYVSGASTAAGAALVAWAASVFAAGPGPVA